MTNDNSDYSNTMYRKWKCLKIPVWSLEFFVGNPVVKDEGPDGTGPFVLLKDGKSAAEWLGRDAITSDGNRDVHNSDKACSDNGVSRPLAGALRGDATGIALALAAL